MPISGDDGGDGADGDSEGENGGGGEITHHSPGTRMSILHPKSPHPPTLSLWVRNKQKYHNIDQH